MPALDKALFQDRFCPYTEDKPANITAALPGRHILQSIHFLIFSGILRFMRLTVRNTASTVPGQSKRLVLDFLPL